MTLSPATADLLASLSDGLAAAVAHAGRSVVAVHGRRRLPASGLVWQDNLVVTAAHVLEPGVDLGLSLEDPEARLPARFVGADPSGFITKMLLLPTRPLWKAILPFLPGSTFPVE